ncbi:tail fiber assembly protein [Serratia marcescens]|uniref:Tail fiber assembly protein n=1 Tax=Serratia marcescens TaxID=615 RepID=A0A5C7C0U2_SERMA|nr:MULTISPECIES: tail fiber assembly protein [Serratia]TXE27158.1 tail fiber assembly protein [Serratia marcescens]TXE55285.1 tail fiber assembly protein [Serratia marcescens]
MTTAKYSLDTPVATLGATGFATTEGWVTTYNSDLITREYVGAREDYLQVGVGLAAGAYADAPTLPTDQNKAVRRTEEGSAWEIVPDYRGKTAYSTDTGQPQPVIDMGDLPPMLTLLAPQTPYDKWDGTQWVTDKEAQHAAEVAAAEAKLSQLLDEADDVIMRLTRAVKYNMATDEEKAQLESWERYSVLLQRINTGDAPSIDWPDFPE